MSSFEVLQLDRFGTFHDISEHFEHSLYPAGEPYVKLGKNAPVFNVPTLVVGRVRGLTEMGYVHEVVRTLRAAGVDKVSIFLPYFPGGRSDRTFSTDDLIMPRGLDLYVNIAKSAKPNYVFTLDEHSVSTTGMLGDIGVTLSSALAVEYAVEHFLKQPNKEGNPGPVAVIAPDEGATSRARAVAVRLDIPLFRASKKRDASTGRLSGFSAPAGLPEGLCLIVDDICDGGGTFAGLLNALTARYQYYHDFALFVTHGVFSGAYEENLKGFRQVVTTNSFLHDTTFPRVPISIYYPLIAKEMTK